MASTAGTRGVPGLAAYGSSKHGIVGLTKIAALDYAAAGIRVNVVAPGPIQTERIAALPEERRDPIAHSVPMGRIGHPYEVADAVVWLSSDAASFTTGAVISIDGGQLAGPAQRYQSDMDQWRYAGRFGASVGWAPTDSVSVRSTPAGSA